jgi:hypothetical protein
MIASMARWMRFIGVVNVVSSLLGAFVVLTFLIYVGAELSTELPALGKIGPIIKENLIVFFSLGLFALVLTVAGTWLGMVLYQAADDFDRVARSDVADQDYITAGVRQLNTYFRVSVLLAVAGMIVGATAAISLAAKIPGGSL